MKIRLAEKILYVTSVFGNWDSNYQPYSVPQQQKALKTLKIPMDIRRSMLEEYMERFRLNTESIIRLKYRKSCLVKI